jgi:hypothetical protein
MKKVLLLLAFVCLSFNMIFIKYVLILPNGSVEEGNGGIIKDGTQEHLT